MALKFSFPFPLFTPLIQPDPQTWHRPPSEIHFSRWYNANAAKFNERRRAQEEIEDDIRRNRRFNAASNITNTNRTTENTNGESFKSIGTPSAPSIPSIPGKKSKYSKPEDSHPAFKRISHVKKGQRDNAVVNRDGVSRQAGVRLGEDGVSYVIDGAPFEFKYSYTETPKIKPIKLREAEFAPFGPDTMPRPWTGRAPLPPSKKKLKEFDSFEPPPPGKKGVKPVQAPGPFLPGSGPRHVRTREEILGEPLTDEEVKELVKSCIKSRRQLNIGRDGLTHNMLDNIHALWKRRRVCKIKCKGVCTVDMDNVCQQLEERTGGKIIYRKDGVVFLFRGRNYNYRTRPRFPLMLWKPASPVYPRLIQRVPEGLTLQEATEMRNKGRELMPICKLAKNGFYCHLVENVREAFEECELVKINCEGLNPSDYKKIGAKLRDLVPCVLLSFQNEHIIMWRGKEWKSSYPKPDADKIEAVKSEVDSVTLPEGKELSASCAQVIADEGSEDSQTFFVESVESSTSKDVILSPNETYGSNMTYDNTDSTDKESSFMNNSFETEALSEVSLTLALENIEPSTNKDVILSTSEASGSNTTLVNADTFGKESSVINNSFKTEAVSDITSCADDRPDGISHVNGLEPRLENVDTDASVPAARSMGSKNKTASSQSSGDQLELPFADCIKDDKLQIYSGALQDQNVPASSTAPCTEGIFLLMKQAVEGGRAVVLDNALLNADIVYERAVAFSQTAPPGPVFRHRPKKVKVQKSEREDTGNLEEEEIKEVKEEISCQKEGQQLKASQKKGKKPKRTRDVDAQLLGVVPQGSLRVDELAKLLA